MWIVYIGGSKHSAWETMKQAKDQKKTLQEFGYKDISFEYDETVNCSDGHYYV